MNNKASGTTTTATMTETPSLEGEVAVVCHECDLLISIPAIAEGCRAQCPRCGFTLTSNHKDSLNRLLAFSTSGLAFLVAALMFPFLSFSAQGQERVITLIQSFTVLIEQQYLALAVIIFIVIVLIPAIFLMGLLYVLSAIRHGYLAPGSISILRLISIVIPWSMVEIFMVGMLVSLIKISSLADVEFGLSFWAYILFSLCTTATVLHIDKFEIWHWVERYAE